MVPLKRRHHVTGFRNTRDLMPVARGLIPFYSPRVHSFRNSRLILGWYSQGRHTVFTFLFGLEQFVQGLYCDFELGTAGFGGGEVSLQDVAHGYREAGLAEDKPGFGDQDELEDRVTPPGYQRVEEGGQDDVEQDVGAAAGVDAADAPGVLERDLAVLLVGGDGLVFGTVVAADGGELHRCEEEQQYRQDRKRGEEGEDAAEGSSVAAELHQAHEKPDDHQRRHEEEQAPGGTEELGENPAPEKEGADYRPAGDALQGRVRGLAQGRGFDLDVDLTLPPVGDAHEVGAEEVEPVPAGHPAERQASALLPRVVFRHVSYLLEDQGPKINTPAERLTSSSWLTANRVKPQQAALALEVSLGEEAGGDAAAEELLVLEDRQVQREGGLQAGDGELVQGAEAAADGALAVAGVHDQLGQQ